jgi:hypothetical protein
METTAETVFRAAVRRMREEQKRWFAGDKTTLRFVACKQTEHAVDKLLALDEQPDLALEA